MIHLDSALAMYRELFDKYGYEFKEESINDGNLLLSVTNNGLTLSVWFDESRQTFGFNMLNGVGKMFNSINEFETLFTTYFYINTEFLPNVELVAKQYNSETNYNLIYDKFVGNINDGFRAVYNVAEDSTLKINIFVNNGNYVLLMVKLENNTNKQVDEQTYMVNDGVVTRLIIYDIRYFVSNIFNKYNNDDNINIERTGTNEFLVQYNEHSSSISFAVEFPNEDSAVYNVLEYISEEYRHTFDIPFNVDMQDIFDMSELYTKVIEEVEKKKQEEIELEKEQVMEEENKSKETASLGDFLNDLQGNTESPEDIGIKVISMDDNKEKKSDIKSDMDLSSLDDVINDLDNANKNNSDETESKESDISDENITSEDDILDDDFTSEFDEFNLESDTNIADIETNDNLDNTNEEVDNNSIENKLVDTDDFVLEGLVQDNIVKFVRFKFTTESFDINADKAKKLGLPVSRIANKVELINHHGMILTKEEIDTHSFAEDISDNNKKCEELIKLFYTI